MRSPNRVEHGRRFKATAARKLGRQRRTLQTRGSWWSVLWRRITAGTDTSASWSLCHRVWIRRCLMDKVHSSEMATSTSRCHLYACTPPRLERSKPVRHLSSGARVGTCGYHPLGSRYGLYGLLRGLEVSGL